MLGLLCGLIAGTYCGTWGAAAVGNLTFAGASAAAAGGGFVINGALQVTSKARCENPSG